MNGKILVTPRSVTQNGHPALERLTRAGYELVFCTPGQQPGEEELRRLLPGCVGYLAGTERISADVLASATSLKVIGRNGTGVSNIDLDAAARLGIDVVPAKGANARGVAELTVGLMLSLVRSIPHADSCMKRAGWERRRGIELENRTLGLIGCGRIGRRVARMALGLGMRVAGYDPCPDASFGPGEGFRFSGLDEVLSRSDIISLHCPPAEDGRPIIDSVVIGRMKEGVYLLNTARGELWDEAAVLEALNRGHIAGVAVDVYPTEPPGDDPLIQHSRVIATPHAGAYTTESIRRAVEQAVGNILGRLERFAAEVMTDA